MSGPTVNVEERRHLDHRNGAVILEVNEPPAFP